MADALGSGPSGLNARGGSSPLARTSNLRAFGDVKHYRKPFLMIYPNMAIAVL